MNLVDQLKGKLVVSCQAGDYSPFHGPLLMAAFAWAAERGGAGGLRVDKPCDIAACRRISSLPIIGIYKVIYPGSEVYITPTFQEAQEVSEAGADILAIDGTGRERPLGTELGALIERIQGELGKPVMCDCSTVEEGLRCAELGADIVASTMAGYTPYSKKTEGPDLEMVARLASEQPKPVIAEGRYWSPEEARLALEAGAHAVVVGTAITVPEWITSRFVAEMAEAKRS